MQFYGKESWTKKWRILFLSLGIFFLPFFAHAGLIEEAIRFKKEQSRLITDNNIEAIFQIGKGIKPKIGDTTISKASLITQMREENVPDVWLNWFERKYRFSEEITSKAFAAAIFYPYESVDNAQKYHVSQMNCAFKACIHYSSLFDSNGVGAEIERGLKTKVIGKISDGILKENLNIVLPFNDGNFPRKAKEYLTLDGNGDRLCGELRSHGTSVQLLNFGRLLKEIGRDDLAELALEEAYSKGAKSLEEERLLDWLDITFVANNAGFIEKAKKYLGEEDNLDRLYGRLMNEGTATQLFNFGMLLKSMNPDMALSCFRSSISKGSQRAQLELTYYEIERGAEASERLSALGPYGVWKTAQCFRYGRKVERNLKLANQFYLESLGGSCEFPEITYDVGDFVEELAVAQKDEVSFKTTAKKAIEYFEISGRNHLGLGYIRATQLMVRARELYADLREDFNDDIIYYLTLQAAQQGSYMTAFEFLKRIGGNPEVLLETNANLMAFIAQINEKFGE